MGKKKQETKTVTKETKKAKPQSATNFMMKFLCDHPNSTEEDVQNALAKKGYKKMSEANVYAWVRDMRAIMAYLKETGKLIS